MIDRDFLTPQEHEERAIKIVYRTLGVTVILIFLMIGAGICITL